MSASSSSPCRPRSTAKAGVPAGSTDMGDLSRVMPVSFQRGAARVETYGG